jgi:hypothetical protein
VLADQLKSAHAPSREKAMSTIDRARTSTRMHGMNLLANTTPIVTSILTIFATVFTPIVAIFATVLTSISAIFAPPLPPFGPGGLGLSF